MRKFLWVWISNISSFPTFQAVIFVFRPNFPLNRIYIFIYSFSSFLGPIKTSTLTEMFRRFFNLFQRFYQTKRTGHELKVWIVTNSNILSSFSTNSHAKRWVLTSINKKEKKSFETAYFSEWRKEHFKTASKHANKTMGYWNSYAFDAPNSRPGSVLWQFVAN